ncbi:hypothetical protein UlMin_021865 [Ulmus minor]
MGLFMDDLSSSVIITHAAVLIALMRWALFWALRNRTTLFSFSSSNFQENPTFQENENPSASSSSSSSIQFIRESLSLTTFGEITERLPSDCQWDTCAVCLNQLKNRDEVRELRNCCHVFHKDCLDRWLDHDHDHHQETHKTCPLCRAPFLTQAQSQSLIWAESRAQPSWAVERLLYLFGDDLSL